MLLKHDQRKILLEVVETMFSTIEDFRTFLKNDVNKRLDEISTGNLATARSDVIDDADEKEWLDDLIAGLRSNAGPEALEKLDALGPVEDILEGRFHEACFADAYPLVNRKDLRERLRKFTQAKSKRILHVTGTRYSGKSHALQHIRYIANTLGIPFAEIELRRFATGEEIRPYDIGLQIANAVPLTLPSHLDDKATRWTINFLNWLVPQLDSLRKRLWIAFDDFESEKLKFSLPDTLYDFIHELAEKSAKSPALRLFLINYEKPLPSAVKPMLEKDPVPPITEKDLGDFFLYVYNDYVPNVDLATAEADAIVRAQRVWAKMAADPAQRLEQMRDALIEECEQLIPGGIV